jgi:transcription antitermination factor NusG
MTRLQQIRDAYDRIEAEAAGAIEGEPMNRLVTLHVGDHVRVEGIGGFFEGYTGVVLALDHECATIRDQNGDVGDFFQWALTIVKAAA